MKKWEYKVGLLSFEKTNPRDENWPERKVNKFAEKKLNKAGNQGWELVGVTFNDLGNKYVAITILKRPK